jgi:DNA-3-methyladenine glycosylase I
VLASTDALDPTVAIAVGSLALVLALLAALLALRARRRSPATGRLSSVTRCAWADSDPLLAAYHDEEWGVPVHNDAALFELLTLEGAQAGLSWLTVLRKREGYRNAFAGFDPGAVARFGERDVARLLGDAGIIRHRGKIEATVANARAVLGVQEELGSLDALVWSFVDGTPVVNRSSSVPAETPTSRALSKELRRRGFRFVGPTTAYAFMQAAGLADDHAAGCFRAG